MEANNNKGLVGQHSASPSVARNVKILLVDHDSNSLQFLAYQFEKQSHKVIATELAVFALSFFRARKTYYDVVIADRDMPDMNIFEFVREILREHTNTPIMLIDKNRTAESILTEAMVHHRVFGVFSKPLSGRHTIQSNPKKSRMTWTPELQEKFLNAIQRLGEDVARPGTILTIMNVPDLKYRHVASYLQKHRNQRRYYFNLPRRPSRTVVQGRQTSGIEALGAPQTPNFLGYPLNNSMNAGAHTPDGSRGVQIAHHIDQSYDANGLHAPNQESASNTGNGEGTANQSTDGMRGGDNEWDIDTLWDDLFKKP